MLPRLFGKTVIERQRRHIEAEIGGALHIGMAAENIGAPAGMTHIAGGEQQNAACPDICRAGGELGLAHRPDQRRRLLVAKTSAMCLTWASGKPVTRSTSSGVHFATSLRISSMP